VADLRILIADDHEVVRRGIRSLLEGERGWTVVAEASNGRQAVELARSAQPHVAILDISMPEMNGLEATRVIITELPACEVLILSMHDSEELVRRVLKSGARGYVLKSDAARDLVSAVSALSRHDPYFTSKVASFMLETYLASSEPVAAPEVALTPREREVVQLLAEGHTNKEVAAALGISVKTAETHRTNVMQKLGVHSLSELIRYAVRNNIITP
jgi:DNA-binding NarL/FixJ family response regulator